MNQTPNSQEFSTGQAAESPRQPPPPPPPQTDNPGKVIQFGRYSKGCDGFDAKAPTVKAVEDAQAFIQKLRTRNLVLPYISLATDGEINFLWNQHSIHLDLGFYGNGKYSYYGRTATGEEYFEDDVSVDSPLPRPILTLLAHAY